MWWEKVKLGNNLLIKSTKGGDLIIDYNKSSESLFQMCIKCWIVTDCEDSVGRKCGKITGGRHRNHNPPCNPYINIPFSVTYPRIEYLLLFFTDGNSIIGLFYKNR